MANPIFNRLAARNVKSVLIKFSGGNDEGFAEDPILTMLDGSTSTLDSYDDELGRDLCQLVYDRYVDMCQLVYDRYDFNGYFPDFSIYGELSLDVAAKTGKFSGEQTEYVPFEESL